MKGKIPILLKVFSIFTCLVLYCEFLNYYIILKRCDWPALSDSSVNVETMLRAMVISDPHLLGSIEGYYLDRLLRDWQMYRAFQTAVYLHQPEVVFVLGDLTIEGERCSDEDFQDVIRRFYSVFRLSQDVRMHVIVGNHDIGFHYNITPHLDERFVKGFNASAVQIHTIKGSHFILVNSMALEGDDCFLCKPTAIELRKLDDTLKCLKNNGSCGNNNLKKYSRPIIMTHFPLYRESDQDCHELDEAPFPDKLEQFKEGYDCLNKSVSQNLLKRFGPRLVLNGHTHHGCVRNLSSGSGVEITVPSFSWRHKNNPSYGLFVFTPNEYAFYKCMMPHESTIICYYIVGVTLLSVLIYVQFTKNRNSKFRF